MKIISFSGGYGAQLLSAAGYFYENKQSPGGVGAYFGYFSKQPHVATPGIQNDISHWKWELNSFGMHFEDFYQPVVDSESAIIWDGAEKGELGFLGLNDPEIVAKFPVGAESINLRESFFGSETYACMHVRRGDYLNVASYVVGDESFLRAAKRIVNLARNLLVISDTPLSEAMQDGLSKLGINCMTAIGGEPHLVHGLMRLSTILICSNSQFSMTAACLRDSNSLTLYPCRHDVDINSYSNKFLENIREFQLITKY